MSFHPGDAFANTLDVYRGLIRLYRIRDEEVVQDILDDLWEESLTYTGDANLTLFRKWARQRLKWRCRDWMRTQYDGGDPLRSHRMRGRMPERPHLQTPERVAGDWELVYAVLSRMDERHARMIVSDAMGMTYPEIAKAEGVSASRVGDLLFRAQRAAKEIARSALTVPAPRH
jgi:DNA-directed RNA polymerase specialized sigma24 family protein